MLISGRFCSVSLHRHKNWFLWDGYTLRSSTLHLSTLGFQRFNQQLVDTSLPIQWWMSAHNVLTVARVIPIEPDTQLFMDALNIGWRPHWNALTGSGVWTTTEKTLHINMLDLEAIHRAILNWLRKLIYLTVLVASAEYSCTDGPRRYTSCVRTTR